MEYFYVEKIHHYKVSYQVTKKSLSRELQKSLCSMSEGMFSKGPQSLTLPMLDIGYEGKWHEANILVDSGVFISMTNTYFTQLLHMCTVEKNIIYQMVSLQGLNKTWSMKNLEWHLASVRLQQTSPVTMTVSHYQIQNLVSQWDMRRGMVVSRFQNAPITWLQLDWMLLTFLSYKLGTHSYEVSRRV